LVDDADLPHCPFLPGAGPGPSYREGAGGAWLSPHSPAPHAEAQGKGTNKKRFLRLDLGPTETEELSYLFY